jgi:hypothetical protein
VSGAAVRLYGLVLLLYPADFRRRYQDEMVQLMIDRHRHDARRQSLVLFEELYDALRAAPRLRWESPMNRTVILVAAGTIAIAVALVAKVVLLPLGALAAVAWLAWGRRMQPIAPRSSSHHWMRWMVAGPLAICVGVAIPAIDGGELDQVWWTAMAIALLSGIGMTVAGLVLATSDRAHRRLAPPR